MKMKPYAIFGLLALALSTAVPVAAQTVVAAETSSSTVAATDDLALRMTVPVLINGQGPFQFVIDTGADRTVISQELAERLGLPEGEKARLHSMGGQADVRTVLIKTVQVSTNIVRDVRAAALPARNLGGDGLLGISKRER
jgi:predicted aspartyl protease